MKKLGTRETAWSLTGCLMGMAIYLVATLPPDQKIQVFQSLVVPIMTFQAFAFGAKVYQSRQDPSE